MATSENGIELAGRRDKFLSLKWEAVEGAASYAVFKEVRDIWDLQSCPEGPKETLGSLRPGNKYLVRVLALNSSGQRLKSLGPATFTTEGDEDKRQPKVKQAALDANWDETLKQYPEQAAKADPYSGATPCPYTWQCTLRDNLTHCATYGHPRPLVCPNGAGCMLANSKDHSAQFGH